VLVNTSPPSHVMHRMYGNKWQAGRHHSVAPVVQVRSYRPRSRYRYGRYTQARSIPEGKARNEVSVVRTRGSEMK